MDSSIFKHEGHHHETPEATLACSTVQSISMITRGLPCAVGVVAHGDDGVSAPYVSMRGNNTDFAHIIQAMIDAVLAGPRPTDCVVCAESFDSLMRARAALGEVVGRC